MGEWLLDYGADLNWCCAWNITATSYAIYNAPLGAIDYLFTRGADVAVANSSIMPSLGRRPMR